MKVYFLSFGCKVNQYETESMKNLFLDYGYNVCDNPDTADIIIINSCTVTSAGDSKTLHALKKVRKLNSNAVIALTGCYPQAFPKEAAEIKEADIIIGTKNRSSVIDLINNAILNKKSEVSIEQYNKCDKFEIITCNKIENKTRAFVKIQDGCNQFCSYCIIPYARGRSRSKPFEDLKDEVSKLAENGHKEIVLVGINLAFYGREFGMRLADAVEACCKIKDVERVRLGSIEPEAINDDDLKRFSEQEKFCPHFHLSLQSGCDKILLAMNRHYNCEEYFKLTEKIHAGFPNASITTDIMTGFPGETEEDFKQTLNFVNKVGFAKIHVFPYSVRKGTKAEKMENQIDASIKNQRAKLLKTEAEKCSNQFLQLQVGNVFPVLFEKESSPLYHQGHTPNYTLVKIPSKNSKKSLRGQIFYVKIIKSEFDYCLGELIENNPY